MITSVQVDLFPRGRQFHGKIFLIRFHGRSLSGVHLALFWFTWLHLLGGWIRILREREEEDVRSHRGAQGFIKLTSKYHYLTSSFDCVLTKHQISCFAQFHPCGYQEVFFICTVFNNYNHASPLDRLLNAGRVVSWWTYGPFSAYWCCPVTLPTLLQSWLAKKPSKRCLEFTTTRFGRLTTTLNLYACQCHQGHIDTQLHVHTNHTQGQANEQRVRLFEKD